MLQWLRRFFSGGGSQPVLHPLIQQSRSDDPVEREAAAVSLGEIREPWATETLFRLLTDISTPVRIAGRAALKRQESFVMSALIDGLKHARIEVSVVCAELLGELRPPEAIDPLIISLKYAERPVQLAARRSLEKFGTIAVPQLKAVINETQPWVQNQIIAILTVIELQAPADNTTIVGD